MDILEDWSLLLASDKLFSTFFAQMEDCGFWPPITYKWSFFWRTPLAMVTTNNSTQMSRCSYILCHGLNICGLTLYFVFWFHLQLPLCVHWCLCYYHMTTNKTISTVYELLKKCWNEELISATSYSLTLVLGSCSSTNGHCKAVAFFHYQHQL